jgi:tetratricopeptide (TPR) repeat protein
MRKFFLFFFAALATVTGNAQPGTEKEIKEIHFSIASTIKRGDSLIAYIKAGRGEGIEKNLFGKCINLYRKEASESYKEIASCKIIAVNDSTSFALIDLYKSNSSRDSVRSGDFVSLNVSIPKKESRTLIFDLAALDIFLADMYRTNMYTISEIIRNDNKVFEDTLINRFVNDIRQTYVDVKDLFGAAEPINQPMVGGRYPGKSVLQVMRDVKAEDVRAYLQFIKSYPFKYMGYDYKANETFATWVLNGALTSATELQELILGKNFKETDFTRLTSAYSKNIIKDRIAEALVEKGVSLAIADNIKDAEKILGQVKKMVDGLNDTAGKAAYYLNMAQLKQDGEKYKEAISLAEESMKYALMAGNKDDELRCLFKKIYCQYKLSDYKGAKETIAVAEKKLALYKPSLTAAAYLENLRKRYEYAGWVDYTSGDYKLALINLREAVSINNEVNTYAAKSNNASNYWYIGKTYLNQGRYKEALQVFDTSLMMYRSVNNSTSEAFLINELGYTHFKLNDYETSIKMHGQAYDLLIPLKGYNNAGYSKSMIGQSLWNLGKYKEAIESHTESIALRKKANNHEGEAFSWEKLGNLYELSGEKTKALSAFDSAAFYYGFTTA